MPIPRNMKNLLVLLASLFFAAPYAQAECQKVLKADRLDFGVKTHLQEYNCPKATDPIADKIQKLDTDALAHSVKSNPNLRSSMALIVNEQTGEIIYAKNAEARTSIASITKLMTAMVTLDAHLAQDEKITITTDDIDHLKNTRSRLGIGTTLTRHELLRLALMSSENRAASALGRNYPGGLPAFVAAMNLKAAQLGMSSTHFVDSNGLHSANQSTAEDLARMVRAAHTYPLVTEFTTTYSYDLQMPFYKRVRHAAARVMLRNVAFHNTNKLVKEEDWQIGVSKTGYIAEAGHCLVMQVTIAKQAFIIVLLDSDGKYTRIYDAMRVKQWLEGSSKPAKRLG